MKILGSTGFTIQSEKSGVKILGDGKAKYDDKCELGSKIDNSKIENNEIRKKDQKTSKSKKLSKSKKTVGSLDFFIYRARLAFTKLR